VQYPDFSTILQTYASYAHTEACLTEVWSGAFFVPAGQKWIGAILQFPELAQDRNK